MAQFLLQRVGLPGNVFYNERYLKPLFKTIFTPIKLFFAEEGDY